MAGREKVVDQQPKFDGGLNSVSDDASVLPNQMRRADNARLTDYGAVTKRGGTKRTTASPIAAASILNGYTWRKDGGTQELMIVCNGLLHTSTYLSTYPWTWTARAGALSTTVTPSFVQFRDASADVVYIADGGLLNVWNGTTLTTNIVGTLDVTNIAVHNQRLWGCGNAAFPDSIFYSALNNGDTFANGSAGGGQIIVRTFSDETVVGVASVNTSLLIFHRRGISRLTGYGQDDITVAPQGLTADVGTIAPRSIVSIGNLGFFVSERGLYSCNESEVAAIGTVDTPDPLLPVIRNLTSAQVANISATFNRATRELWINVPAYGVYVYHTVLRAWSGPWESGFLDPATTTLFDSIDSDGLPALLRGDEDGYVTTCDETGVVVDNQLSDGTGGTPYTMTVQMHRMYCGDDALAKSLRFGYITASLDSSSSTIIKWVTDTVTDTFTLPTTFVSSRWGNGVWGYGLWGSANSSNYRVQLSGTGYYIDVSIIDAGQTIPVFGRFQLETFALGRR
tara:strand:+ start:307 stop:1836 length:1530 start_codon:yes stop_codon:yes gene_type:complete